MKWFARIMALYVLVLSCLPCFDSRECADSNTVSIAANNPHPVDHSNHLEACTPFCSCACCGVQVTTIAYSWQIHFTTTPDAQHGLYRPAPIASPFYNIWQPPQLMA